MIINFDKIHTQMIKKAPNTMRSVNFFEKTPSFLHINLSNLVSKHGFLESMFAISDSITSIKKKDIIITTHNNFVFYLVKKTNQKLILFYDIKEIKNVCF